jgi:hypothetical protein
LNEKTALCITAKLIVGHRGRFGRQPHGPPASLLCTEARIVRWPD